MSITVYSVIAAVLMAGALAAALLLPAKDEVPPGQLPEVRVTARGPNQVVDEVIVRPFVAASLASIAPTVN